MARINCQIGAFIFAILFVQSALGLKCYVCNSQKDPACSAPQPPAKYLQECSQDTLEILNDMHRQTKLQEAADQAAEKNAAADSNAAPLAEHPGHDDAASAAIPVTASPIPLDHNDKDLALNRTARSSEEISHPVPTTNGSAPAVPFVPVPIKLPKEATFCRRTAYHIPEQVNGPNSTLKANVRIILACGWIPEEKKAGQQGQQSGCKWIGTEGIQMDQCACNTDGCNAGNYLGSLTLQTLILMAVMSAGYFYIL